jgi:hypothetical protein
MHLRLFFLVLCLALAEGVQVLDPANPSRAEKAPIRGSIGPEWTVAGPLASGDAPVLAFSGPHVWRLGTDGLWTSHDHGVAGEIK